jgi:hypothetical protein
MSLQIIVTSADDLLSTERQEIIEMCKEIYGNKKDSLSQNYDSCVISLPHFSSLS